MHTRTFNIGDVALSPGSSYQRKRPARTASIESDVVVPGLQATITGCLAGMVGISVAIIAKSNVAAIIGIVSGAGALGLAWLWLLHEHRELLWEIETIVGADLNGDGQVGAPEPSTVHVEIKNKPRTGETHLQYFELPVDQHRMATIARSILSGVPFSEVELVSRRLISGPKFRELQDVLISREMLRWRNEENHRLGVEIMRGGLAMFRAFSDDPTPLPQRTEV